MQSRDTEDIAFRLAVIKAKVSFVGLLEELKLPITTMKVGWAIRRRQYKGGTIDIKNLVLDTGFTKSRVLDHVQALIDAGTNLERKPVGRNTYVEFTEDSEGRNRYFDELRKVVDELVLEMAENDLIDWVADVVAERKKKANPLYRAKSFARAAGRLLCCPRRGHMANGMDNL